MLVRRSTVGFLASLVPQEISGTGFFMGCMSFSHQPTVSKHSKQQHHDKAVIACTTGPDLTEKLFSIVKIGYLGKWVHNGRQ